MSRAVVFGASGFIGGALVRHLRGIGQDVVGISRSPSAEVDHIVGAYAIPEIRPLLLPGDVVLHLAAKAHTRVSPSNEHAFRGNLETTEALLDACTSVGVHRFILLSSIGVNGSRTEGRPFHESDIPAPREAYARSKFECERRVVAATIGTAMTHVIVRPPLVYGHNAPGNFGRLVQAVRKGRPLPVGAIDNRRSFIALDNLTDFLAHCLDHPNAAQQTFLVADGESLSTAEWVRRMAKVSGRRSPAISVPPSWLKLVGTLTGQRASVDRLCDSLEVDARKAGQLLNWRAPFTVDEALALTMRD